MLLYCTSHRPISRNAKILRSLVVPITPSNVNLLPRQNVNTSRVRSCFETQLTIWRCRSPPPPSRPLLNPPFSLQPFPPPSPPRVSPSSISKSFINQVFPETEILSILSTFLRILAVLYSYLTSLRRLPLLRQMEQSCPGFLGILVSNVFYCA